MTLVLALVVEIVNGGSHSVGVGERDKGKAAAMSGELVFRHRNVSDVADVFEHLAQHRLVGGPSQAAHFDLVLALCCMRRTFRLHHQFQLVALRLFLFRR